MNPTHRTIQVRGTKDRKLIGTVRLEPVPTGTGRCWDVMHHERRIGSVTRTTTHQTRVDWTAQPTDGPSRGHLGTRNAALAHLIERTNR